MNSRVAIIIVNYNGWEDTIECLESLLRQDYPAFSIYIVDNASSDNSVHQLQSWANGTLCISDKSLSETFTFSPVKKPVKLHVVGEKEIGKNNLASPDPKYITLIISTQNRGFAGGNNLATELAIKNNPEINYFWYLNNDTVVHADALALMVQTFEKHIKKGIKLGLLGAKLMFYHSPTLIQAIGATYNKWYSTSNHIGSYEPDQGQYDKDPGKFSLDYIVGASMLVSREFLEKVGFMNPEYFLYFEELDWVIRGKQVGFTYTYSPHSIVYHKEGKSTGGSSQEINKSYLADFYNISNRINITKKYFPSYQIPVYLSLFVAMLNRVKRGQFSRVKMILSILIKAIFPSHRN